MRTSVALGMFDGVHIGHIEVIRSALGREGLQPAVFTFKFLNRSAHNIIPYGMKFTLLRAAGVKTLYSSNFDDVRDLSAMEFVRDILVERMNCGRVSCGWNFRFSKDASADANDLKRICGEYGIEVNIVKPVEIDGETVSSTRIRKAIREGDIVLANRMLGYELSYEFEVVEGRKLGRKLGAPTINQVIPEECVRPKFGVYKSAVLVDDERYIAVTNVGMKPSTGYEGGVPLIETYIPGFNMELYGQTIRVSLQKFIRPEKKFGSLDELKAQIQQDVKAVLA